MLLIGKGTTRKVYAINDKLVLKVAFNNLGIEQNKTEVLLTSVYPEGPLAKILYYDLTFKWVIQERATLFKDKLFLKKLRKRTEESELDFFIEKANLCRPEVSDWPNVGMINNRIVFIDFGSRSPSFNN